MDPGIPPPSEKAELGMSNMAFASVLLLGVVVGSRFLRLEMESKVVTAALRATVQLGVLGSVILVPIFKSDSPVYVVAYLAFMLLVAAREACTRALYRYDAVFLHAFAAIAGVTTTIASYAVVMVISPTPWWNPQ